MSTKFRVTQEDINLYVANNGDLDILTEEQIEAVPQEFINRRVANGGALSYKDDYGDKIRLPKIETVPQEIINKRVADGGVLADLYEFQMKAIPQEVCNKRVANGKNFVGLLRTKVAAISQEAINQYVAKGGFINTINCPSGEQIEAVPQKYINEYVKHGGNLRDLPKAKLAAVPQEIINEYAANGGELDYLLHANLREKIEAIPQEYINQRAATGGNLWRFSKEQIEAIPQEFFNRRAATGGNLKDLPRDRVEKIPQELLYQNIAKGGSLELFSKEQIAAIPQEIINKHVENSDSYDPFENLTAKQVAAIPLDSFLRFYMDRRTAFRDNEYFTEEQRDVIKGYKIYVSEQEKSKANAALILYGAGKISSNDLPPYVFIDSDKTEQLLDMVKIKTKKQFNEICLSNGYENEIPVELVQTFDEQLEAIKHQVVQRGVDAYKEFLTRVSDKGLQAKNGNLQKAIEETKDLGW